MTLSPQNWQQVSAVSKKPILKASPQSQQLGVIESNLKFGWDWPSGAGINDNVQWEKASKKWDNNVLCLVILLTKCGTSEVATLGATKREKEKGGNLMSFNTLPKKSWEKHTRITCLNNLSSTDNTHPPTVRREGERSGAAMHFQFLFSKYSLVYPLSLVSEALDSLNWITTHTFHFLSG